jgi:hypothetical protein
MSEWGGKTVLPSQRLPDAYLPGEQSRTLRLTAGLFMIRYVRSRAGQFAPVVKIEPPRSGNVEFVLPDGMTAPVLEGIGDGIVLRVYRSSMLKLRVIALEVGGSLDAELTLEPVSTIGRQLAISHDGEAENVIIPRFLHPREVTARQIAARQAPAGRMPLKQISSPDFSARPLGGRQIDPQRASRGRNGAVVRSPGEDLSGHDASGIHLAFEVIAHVSRRGDVMRRSGEWIAGPGAPMAIEGLEIIWPDRPPGTDICIKITVKDRGIRVLPEGRIGQFVGSRGRSAPIIGFDIALIGDGSGTLELNCDALFLGPDVVSARGRRIVFRGPTGRDALVGLRLSVVTALGDTLSSNTNNCITKRSSGSRVVNDTPSGRVRVFRSSERRTDEFPGAIGVK